jgi:hypothetical protein
MDGFLGATLERMNEARAKDLLSLRESFDRSMELNFRLFGRHAFRKSLALDIPQI